MSRSQVHLTDNPIRIARKRMGKTVEECANAAGINWQTWYLAECGCYEQIPPAITAYFSRKNLSLSSSDYRAFQIYTQKRFGEVHAIRERKLPSYNLFVAPIKAYREFIGVESRAHFAKGICVQVSHLYKLEHGLCKHLPAQVYSALLVAGLPVEEIEDLDERTQEFYESNR